MSTLEKGRVIRADAKVVHVDFGDRVLLAALRGKLFEVPTGQTNPIAVGDWVTVDTASEPASVEVVLPRTNWLGRLASTHDPREQVLFANVERLFVVSSVRKPPFSSNRTDRILAACAWHDIPATLVLNKVDLADEEEVAALRESYAGAQVEVLETCAVDGRGIEELRAALEGRVSAMYGGSGVGKSSLLNALQPGLKLKIGKISKYWDAGKHTTTHSQFLPLAFGGAVIDTPGIRVFRLHGATQQDLRGMFPELVAHQAGCHYPSCTHVSEPDCAVVRALDTGAVAETRYASYLELMNEIRELPELEGAPEAPESDGEESN
ncbi:MAG: ribosome small subunit-dependent GTPase A [Planctomycetes bacterium]|nr:ribosome small subunit-dependent GTPase A [Planctomycetota bacterium]